MSSWPALIAAIVTEVIGTSLLKPSEQFTRLWPTLGVLVFYGISFWFLAAAVRELPVGIVYASWSGLGIALIALIGWAFLGQRLDAPAVIGLALIVAGVAVIQLFSDATPH